MQFSRYVPSLSPISRMAPENFPIITITNLQIVTQIERRRPLAQNEKPTIGVWPVSLVYVTVSMYSYTCNMIFCTANGSMAQHGFLLKALTKNQKHNRYSCFKKIEFFIHKDCGEKLHG